MGGPWRRAPPRPPHPGLGERGLDLLLSSFLHPSLSELVATPWDRLLALSLVILCFCSPLHTAAGCVTLGRPCSLSYHIEGRVSTEGGDLTHRWWHTGDSLSCGPLGCQLLREPPLPPHPLHDHRPGGRGTHMWCGPRLPPFWEE